MKILMKQVDLQCSQWFSYLNVTPTQETNILFVSLSESLSYTRYLEISLFFIAFPSNVIHIYLVVADFIYVSSLNFVKDG